MPKLLNRYGAFNSEYLAIRKDSDSMRETNDCGVVAVVAVTGLPYSVCHKALADGGRPHRQGCHAYTVERALTALGFTMKRVNDDTFIHKYPAPHNHKLRSCTTAHPQKFNHVWRDGHNYFVGIRGHWLGIRNGEVIDWSQNRCKRMVTVWRVEKIATDDYTVSG